MEPLAYSVPEALAALRIGRTQFYEEVKAGRIIIAKAGNRTLVPVHRAREWLQQRELPVGDAA